MKKLLLLIVLSVTTFSCNQTKNAEQEVTLIRGEFILTEDAGVIKGKDFIYGVELNDMAKALDQKVKPYQREEYDMVPVVINGVLKPNPNSDGWEQIVDIKEIIGITRPTSELPTKIKAKENKEEISETSATEAQS